MGAVVLVLLVACANVGALALSRIEARRTELAVRASLGAGRVRLARQLVAESVGLALAGGAVGTAAAVIGLRTFMAAAPPGVTRAGLSTHLPFSPSEITVSIASEGTPYVRGQAPQLGMEMFNGDYFGAMGLTLLRGQIPIDDTDVVPRSVVINQAAARAFWPGEDPLGKTLSFDVDEGVDPPDDSWFTVVGVVADVRKQSLEEEPGPLGYFPLPDFTRWYGFVSGRYFRLVVATDEDPALLVDPIRSAVAEIDPALPLRGRATLDELVRATTVSARFRTLAFGVFAVLAALVAFVGVYGVTAYRVSRSVREIGLRIALGASGGGERRRVLRTAAVVVAGGAGAGVAGTLVASPALRSVLFEVSPGDPLTVAAVLAVTASGSLLAAYVPALRASRVDPMRVLHED
jgi:hypothetical protein